MSLALQFIATTALVCVAFVLAVPRYGVSYRRSNTAAGGSGKNQGSKKILGSRGTAFMSVRTVARMGVRIGESPARGHNFSADAAEFLRQLSSLLQSGRSETQAWSDLREYWKLRPGIDQESDDHPLEELCAHVVAAETLGQGSAEGLRRYSDELTRRLSVRQHSSRLPPVLVRFTAGYRYRSQLLILIGKISAAVKLSDDTGAPLSDLMQQTASGTESAAELVAALKTATAGPRLTQLILSCLPLGGLFIGQVIGVSPLGVLVSSPLGWVCAIAGIGLMLLGFLWSNLMIRQVSAHV